MVLGFEVNEHNIIYVPDSLPADMGVCIVRYLDCTGVPYQGYYGRPIAIMESPLDPIPPISVSDSIYGGVIGGQRDGRLELFGYPGEYEVPIMFRLNYRRYWHYDQPLIVHPYIDTLSVFLVASCTTYVDAVLPWSPKVLVEDCYFPGETSYYDGYGMRGKLRIVDSTIADSSYHILTHSNSSRFLCENSGSNYTSYDNTISLYSGYNSIDLILPHLHSIRLDSVLIENGDETLITIQIPENATLPSQESLESLLEYPDEWVNPHAQVSTMATIRIRPENEKSGNLVNMYFYQDEARFWRFISVFRNGVYTLDSNDHSNWYPISYYVSDVLGVDKYGSRILLNVVNRESVVPYLMSINIDEIPPQIYSYTDIGLVRFGYPRYPSFSLSPELKALPNGVSAFLGYGGIRLFNADYSGTVWEVDSLPDYAYGLNREVVFSEQADCCLITNRHTSVSSPVIIVDSEGEIQELSELSEGYFTLVYASSNFDTLMYRSNEGSLHLGIRNFDSCYSDSILFDGGITSCRFASNLDRLIVKRDDTISLYNSTNISSDSAILEFPVECDGWSVTNYTLLANGILVLELLNESHEHRIIALSVSTKEILWLSPVRSDFTNALHLLRIIGNSCYGSFYAWNDGVIRLMEFSELENRETKTQPLNAAELPRSNQE